MGKVMSIKHTKLVSLLAGLLLSCVATAQTTYKENFSSTTTSNQWIALNDACLTASTAASDPNGVAGCTATKQVASSTHVMSTADADKSGALRLTPATTSQAGAILSNFTFLMSQGLEVTFTTYTYGGSKDSPAKDGADGISFMLTDGTKTIPTVAGGLGGSMGYSCSNGNSQYEGMANAYLGVGIDEFGNFLNAGDNTSTGILNSRASGGTKAFGDNAYSSGLTGISAGGGSEYQPQRIGLRAAGNTTWAALQALNAAYYTGSVDETKTQAACSSGTYVSSTTTTTNKKTGKTTTTNNFTALPFNYNAIAGGYQVLPDGSTGTSTNPIPAEPIANEGTSTRAGNPSAPADFTQNAWPITYKLTLSTAGLLNFSYSYNNGAFQPVLANHDVTADSGTPPALLRFGFSAGTGGSYNVHEITCFQAAPLQSNSSASANTVQSGQVKTGSQVYLASYSSDNWWGSLVSDSLVTSGSTLSVATVANWDAKCVLTGGGCAAMGTDASGTPTTTIAVQGPAARTLLTWDSAAGAALPLEWASLTASQKTVLNSTDNAGANRVAWLRGDRTVEQLQSPPGTLRARTGVLGDIVNSSPTWVGAPVAGANPDVFSDGLYGTTVSPPENGTSAQVYSAFAAANVTRLNVVYVGANDGLLHGFEAGANTAAGAYDSTKNDGKEVVGFMPSAVLSSTATVSLTNPTYVHNYFVDATPAAADLFYGNAWHTWLVGGVGTGGSEIFALDITNPTSFSESAPGSVVKGDWTSATTGLSHLGQTVGTPIITRMHNGQWAIIFGNGLSSGTSAGVYIGLVDSSTGAVTFQFVDTGVGSATSANGIAYVASADLDGDHIADYLYAGDLQGNVWRIDVTSKTAASWGVSKFGNGTATPLFVAKNAAGTVQPITTAATIAAVTTGNVNRVMVLFGTGQKTPLTATSPDVYATGQQTYYGIWDWDMTAWNAAASSRTQYANLAGPQAMPRTSLLAQTVVSTTVGTGSVLGFRNLSTTNVVCWQGSTTCTSGNTQFGWLFDLPATQEQIIFNSAIVGGAVVVSTAIPPVISASQCNPGLQSGWTMAFNPASGGALPLGFFPNSSGSFGAAPDGSATGGIQLNAVGSPTTVTFSGQTYIVTQTVTGVPALSQVNPPSNDIPSRISWREIRN
jgi:type IV pilus assembly protein PilY1